MRLLATANQFAISVAVSVVLAVSFSSAQESAQPATPETAEYKKIAPLLDGMGDHHHAVSTDNDLAQRYFDQGLVLAFGFNHAEAARCFRQVQVLDPNCPMGYWGQALVLGPNINAPMLEENVPKAWHALQQALKHIDRATPRHRDYIRALTKRYAADPPDDRSSLDQAYADAMRNLAANYPEDYDAQTLFAESLMDTTPWDYWQENGQPKDLTRELLQTLERVLARRPKHPLANHLYIHAVEAQHPEWAEACADRLRDLVPGAGHLVHMPAHIYIRVARYEDANAANERANDADQAYLTQCHAQGLYTLGYVPHNHHFLWFGKAMTGESRDCLAAARHVRKHVDKDKMRQPGLGTLQHFYTLPMWTYIRFCMWDEALAEEKPADDLKYPIAVWHFARGMALARTGQAKQAQAELYGLARFAADKTLEDVTIWDLNTTRDLLQIAEQVLNAAVAEAEGDFAAAEKHLHRAVELEDALNYDEPPSWFIPPRQLLGAVLLTADKPAEAEATYREQLKIYPDNGWSLMGLHQALKAQGKDEAAAEAKRRFEKAWANADVTLASSREVTRAAATSERDAYGAQLGTVHFPVSCNKAARPHMQRGLALLHHMTYVGAREEFAAAANADPDCAMSYWGQAMTFIHPIWSDPPSEAEFNKGRSLVEKANTRGKKTPREQAYIAAVQAYYDEGWNLNETENLAGFEQQWEKVHRQFPDDIEALAFYALAHLATNPADKSYATQKRAGELARRVLDREPDHPGGHHYLIHAYDYPPLAEKALSVAREYSKIAPEVPHALHMPTHIFTRLGLWEESIEMNRRSAAAALKHPAGEKISLHYPHALDYLVYAYLQRGEEENAREIARTLATKEGPYQVEIAVPYALAAIPARLALERRDWKAAAALEPKKPASFPWDKFPAIEAITHFARALGAARAGNVEAASESIAKLEVLRDQAAETSAYWAKQVEIQQRTAEAWLAFEQEDRDEALRTMREAARLEATTEKHPVTPGEVLPAHELLADMLLELERYDDALAAYRAALDRSPNRLNSLYSAGRAAELAGDASEAASFYKRLLNITPAKSLIPQRQQAHSFLRSRPARD